MIVVGLLQGLGSWLLLAAGFGWCLQRAYGLQAIDTVGIALLVSALAGPAVALLLSAWGCAREMRLIRRGAAAPAPADGQAVVLVGVIEALGPVLRAPLDRAPCVAYRYEVLIDRGSGKRRNITPIARGVALTPSHIRSASGSHKLLAVPELQAVESAAPLQQRIQNFLAYAETAPFTEGRHSAQELLQRWADDDGSYRSDVSFMPTAGADTGLWLARQQQVPAGAQVCVFGCYSLARGGVVPSGLKPVRLVCGSPGEVAASWRKKVMTRFVMGAVLTALAAWLLAALAGQAGGR